MSRAVSTTLRPVAFVAEISLYQADPALGLFEAAGGGYRSDEPPPFWAFPWAGGQALARYLLDHPGTVAGQRVLDLGTGSGLVALAAARAGAARVHVVDADPGAIEAAARNATANGLTVYPGPVADPDVVLAGDVFYSPSPARELLAVLRGMVRGGGRALVGDADRGYLPVGLFERLAGYDVPVPVALEDAAVRPASVWELRRPIGQPDHQRHYSG